MNRFRLTLLLTITFIAGCATQVPTPITTTPASNLTVAEVQSDPARFKGTQVRWGGVITRVENQASQTWVEVVSHTLGKNGEPLKEGNSNGRFIASFSGFVDPLVYSNGRSLTVVGTFTEVTSRPIGEYQYSFPVVAVTTSYLWPVEVAAPPRPDYPPPYWYYDPWSFYPRPYPFIYPPYRW